MTELERIFNQLKSSPNGWDISRRAYNAASSPGEVWVSLDPTDFVLLYGVPKFVGIGCGESWAHFFDMGVHGVGQMTADRDGVHIKATMTRDFVLRNVDLLRDLLEKVDQTILDDLGITL